MGKDVYFIQDGPGGPFKVGCSNHPKGRLNDMQSHNPRKMRLVGLIRNGDYRIEKELQEYFWSQDKLLHREWFDLELEDVRLALRKYAKKYEVWGDSSVLGPVFDTPSIFRGNGVWTKGCTPTPQEMAIPLPAPASEEQDNKNVQAPEAKRVGLFARLLARA